MMSLRTNVLLTCAIVVLFTIIAFLVPSTSGAPAKCGEWLEKAERYALWAEKEKYTSEILAVALQSSAFSFLAIAHGCGR